MLLAVAAGILPARAQISFGGAAPNLLEPEKAFRFSARMRDARNIEVRFAIADGYYMYRDKFKFSVTGAPEAKLGAPDFPAGVKRKDEFFGEVETYRKEVRIGIPLERGASAQTLVLDVTSQGCADIGVCYVPMDSRATLQLAALGKAEPGGEVPALTEAPREADVAPRLSIFASDFEIAALFQGSTGFVLGGFFVLGLLLAFTPCVLPMIPILSGIIAGEGRELNKLRALALSLSYVMGMALAYAAAGVAAAYSGTLLAAGLQNPWVLGTFALVFVVLALSAFGFFELQLPQFLHNRLSSAHQQLRGGRMVSVALMGAFSAVIVSPCVAAPLAGALLYISQTKDVLLGGSALFSLALGMGAPLIAVGVSEGALLPRAGAWMAGVRQFFGVLLLAVAIWVVAPVIPVYVQLLAWAALLIGSGVFLRGIDPLPDNASGWRRLWKGVGVMALLTGAALLVGAFSGARDPLRPLAALTSGSVAAAAPLAWTPVRSSAELDERLRAPGRPVMLDFYADWCVSCKEMEAFTFTDPRVRAKMAEMLLVRADVTANNAADKALLKRFSLFGPPGIIFFDARGKEIRGLRVVGYQNADRFLETLVRATAP